LSRSTTYTLSVSGTAGDDSATVTVTVQPATPAVAALTAALPATATTGTPVSLVVKAVDNSGNPVTGFSGTVHLGSADAAATLPAATAFAAADAGQRDVSITLRTAGAQTITARDLARPAIVCTATSTVTVAAAALNRFAFSGLPAGATSGAAVTFTVTA